MWEQVAVHVARSITIIVSGTPLREGLPYDAHKLLPVVYFVDDPISALTDSVSFGSRELAMTSPAR